MKIKCDRSKEKRLHPTYIMYNEITYSYPNFGGAAVEVWAWIINFCPHCTEHACLSMQEFKKDAMIVGWNLHTLKNTRLCKP